MAKKIEIEESEISQEWLTTYSDMITLVLCFFVLMFAISNVDALKFQLLAKGLSRDGITAEQFIDLQLEYDMSGVGEPDPDAIEYPAIEDIPSTSAKDSAAESENESESAADLENVNPELDILYQLIMNYIDENELHSSVTLDRQGENLLLTLTSDIWFSSGSAEVTPFMKDNAAVLAQLLSQTQNDKIPYEVVVEGHTDNVPQNTPQYPSNWHLSFGRAYNFLDILITESGLHPRNFSARACGEEVPIADNDTPEGRQKNRRVEVYIRHVKE